MPQKIHNNFSQKLISEMLQLIFEPFSDDLPAVGTHELSRTMLLSSYECSLEFISILVEVFT